MLIQETLQEISNQRFLHGRQLVLIKRLYACSSWTRDSPSQSTCYSPICHHNPHQNPQTCNQWIAESPRPACPRQPSFWTERNPHVVSRNAMYWVFAPAYQLQHDMLQFILGYESILIHIIQLERHYSKKISVLSSERIALFLHFNFSSGVPFIKTLSPSTNLLCKNSSISTCDQLLWRASTWNLGIVGSLHRRQMHSTVAAKRRRLTWSQSARIAWQTTREAWAQHRDRGVAMLHS